MKKQRVKRAIKTCTFARTGPLLPSIIGEVKIRETKKFSKEEAIEFERKFEHVKNLENIDRAVEFIFSRSGFTKEAETYCKEKGIACSEDERWMYPGKLKPPVV